MNIPNVIELTFLRKDRFKNGNRFVSSEIPHPKDIANVISRRPIHLNEKWFHPKKRRFISKVKMFKDNLIFYLFCIYSKFPLKNIILKFHRLR